MSETNRFAQKLRELRRQKGLSQTELAKAVDVALLTVFRWEKGERQPRINELQRLCEIFECTKSELLNEQSPEDGELRVLVNKKGVLTADMTTSKSSAVLNMSDDTMAIMLSAGYELWEDDAKFEELIEDLRRKRTIGLRTRKEDW